MMCQSFMAGVPLGTIMFFHLIKTAIPETRLLQKMLLEYPEGTRVNGGRVIAKSMADDKKILVMGGDFHVYYRMVWSSTGAIFNRRLSLIL